MTSNPSNPAVDELLTVRVDRHDQATNIKEGTYNLDSIMVLQNQEDLHVWLVFVRTTLRIHGMEDLLDYEIPRPSQDNPKYSIWETCSLKVYADEFLQKLQRTVDGRSCYRYKYWREIIEIRRHDYATVEQYVTAVVQKTIITNRLDMPLTPYQALAILLRGIEDEYESFVDLTYHRLPENAAKDLTWSQFFNICGEVKQKARYMPASKGKNNRRSRTPRKHSPPQNINH
ncbi:hypothetical protein P175DRAFT_0520886 [Aspergillus ochraceoroseus IBT 24754]|uniref:Uncharacterized protein n=1 Tax=Aspergillus ochraceoroseus IBT 24754 TaxID=1392256 RepID=A0A2T5M957_9EURO|nr:uncharacterized protein P175DRAFT_0520886 [Aspergillus ochraceoroseus IBT 24754]PTU25071.1 hypothetical protein P175DRAFT_0520886 [Aspergillus ochraceoroseus IBT 24754]